MSVQERNPERTDLQRGEYCMRYEPNRAWGDTVSMFLDIAMLRGFWPMSSVGVNLGDAIDISGQGRFLTAVGNPFYGYRGTAATPTGLPSYINLDGSDHLRRADEAALDLSGAEAYVDVTIQGLTLGCWVYCANAAAAIEYIMCKWNGAGGAATANYFIRRTAGGALEIYVGNGVASDNHSGGTLLQNTWHHVVGRFDTNNGTLAVFLDGTKYQKNTALATPLNNNNHDFTIGARDAGGGTGGAFLTGLVSFAFLSACALSDVHIKTLFNHSKALFGVH